MRWDVALVLRLIVHIAALILGLTVALASIVAVVVALFGTGGFTADPPPAHPNFLSAAVVVAICAALESLLLWSWRKVVHFLDAAEALVAENPS